jgi:ribonuclease P protein component
MFSRLQRFTTKTFDRFFHDRRKTRVQTGDIIWFIKPNTAQNKIAIVVSKKNIKSAVKRNRIRRQLQAIIRLHVLPKLSVPREIMCLYQKEFKTLDQAGIIADLPKIIDLPHKKFVPRNKK